MSDDVHKKRMIYDLDSIQMKAIQSWTLPNSAYTVERLSCGVE